MATQDQPTKTRLITLQAITFLHPGTGQTTGVVDLPVQREVHTGYPMFAASGLKGSLRDKAEQNWGKDSEWIKTLFGSGAGEQENPAAGSFSVTDARILAFPVRSMQQVFVWVTCSMVLQRLQRDAGLLGQKIDLPDFSETQDVTLENAWVSETSEFQGKILILEDLNFTLEKKSKITQLGKDLANLLDDQAGFDPNRLVVIPNDDFQHLVRYATQVSARIKLNDRKTTDGDGGNLWYEETLPPETILYALALCHNPRNARGKTGSSGETNTSQENSQGKQSGITNAQAVAEKLDDLLQDRFLQIGGNETVGQGWCCVNVNGASKGEPS